ncbi:hypothetical protein BaRGS_00005563, partial [Batillaria attramentaria]
FSGGDRLLGWGSSSRVGVVFSGGDSLLRWGPSSRVGISALAENENPRCQKQGVAAQLGENSPCVAQAVGPGDG